MTTSQPVTKQSDILIHPLVAATRSWRHVAASLGTVIVAMAGFWLVEGRHFTTQQQVRDMIVRESPYVQDRNMVLDRLSETAHVNRELTRAINDLRVEISELRVQRKGQE